MQRIYIAGCGGMLGEAFHRVYRGRYELRCTDVDVNEPWLAHGDFRDLDAYRRDVEAFAPDFLFHVGAHTDLEYCERNPDDAYLTNTLAVENAVWIANDLDVPLLYIGTAGVFDGAKARYDDWDEPNPLGVYARSKLAGERFVVGHARRYLVCRAGWMMGGGPRKDKKFVHKVMRQLREGRRVLHVVNDKLGTPTYTHDFVRNVELLLERRMWGLYNVVCAGQTSRLEVAKEILRLVGLAGRVEIREVGSDWFKAEYFAERPPCEALVNRKLGLRSLDAMRDWREALADYLAEYYRGYLEARHEPSGAGEPVGA
jgi:dTDP-4-dehydrorhamnose reductase